MKTVYLIVSVIIFVSLVIIYNLLPGQKEGAKGDILIDIPRGSNGKYTNIPPGYRRVSDSQMTAIRDGYILSNDDTEIPIPDGYSVSEDKTNLISTSTKDRITIAEYLRITKNNPMTGGDNPSAQDISTHYSDNTIPGIADIPKGSSGKNSSIPVNYMQINKYQMAPIPSGYTLSSDKKRLVPTPGEGPYNDLLRRGRVSIPKDQNGNNISIPAGYTEYGKNTMSRIPVDITISEYLNTIVNSDFEVNNLDVTYHGDWINGEEDWGSNKDKWGSYRSDQRNKESNKQNPFSDEGIFGSGKGSYQQSQWSDNRWWEADKVRSNYNPAYVPSYEDSVYFSTIDNKRRMYPKHGYEITSPEIAGGFCSAYSSLPEKLEEACNKTDHRSCGSTTCCVLVGGTKCVAGDETGPVNKSIYSDLRILNKDYYYYKGKCYGNCNK